MSNTEDLYEILQVHHAAEPEVIEVAYKRLLRMYHPDVNKRAQAHEATVRLNRAYEVLRDPAKRADYDRQRGSQAQSDRRQRQRQAEQEAQAERERRTRAERQRREKAERERRPHVENENMTDRETWRQTHLRKEDSVWDIIDMIFEGPPKEDSAWERMAKARARAERERQAEAEKERQARTEQQRRERDGYWRQTQAEKARQTQIHHLFQAVKEGDIETVTDLIDADFDVNYTPGGSDYTLLHWAAWEGHTEIALKLIYAGADVTKKAAGSTPLDLAAKKGHTETVTAIREIGGVK